jgi:hypothetical protein
MVKHLRSATRPTLVAAGAALVLAGCGTSNQTPTSAASSAQGSNAVVNAAYRYSACMRSHGVPSFPDPHVVTTSHSSAIGIHPLPKSIASSPQFKAAETACHGIMASAEKAGPKENHDNSPAHKQAMLAFAQCLRGHGESGFPDPTAEGDITPQTLKASGVDIAAPAFLTAARACVGVTKGEITVGQVIQAIHHFTSGADPSSHENGSGSGG